MATELQDLELSEISIVDNGACREKGIPRARVALLKRDAKALSIDEVCKALEENKTPADALAAVIEKARQVWRAANPGRGDELLPSALTKEVTKMTFEETVQKQLSELKAGNDVLTARIAKFEEDANVAKAAEAAMVEAEKAEIEAAKRKSMDDAACKAKKKKPADDSAEDGEPEPDEDDLKEAKKRDETEAALKADITKANTEAAATREELTKTQARLAEIEKRERVSKFAHMGEAELPHTSGTAATKGAMLMKLADSTGGEDSEVFKEYFEGLKSADAVMASNFNEIGKVGGGNLEVIKQIDAKVTEIAKRDNITPAAAMVKALTENPDLYEQYDRERPKVSV